MNRHAPRHSAHLSRITTSCITHHLFNARPGLSVQAALLSAAKILERAADNASDMASEMAGVRSSRFRPSPQAIIQQMEEARALIKSAIEAMDRVKVAANDDSI